MDVVDDPDEQARATRKAMEQSGLTLADVWMRYFSFSGCAGEYEVDAYLNTSLEMPQYDRDLIAHAVNELIDELPPRQMAPYSSYTALSFDRDPSQEDDAPQDRT